MSKRSKSSQGYPAAPITPFFCAAAAYLAACLILGGSTSAGVLADVVLQILAVPLLLWAAWRLLEIPSKANGRRARTVILLCVAAAAVPLAHLLPLPPAMWAALPERGDFVEVLATAGLEPGWRPLSMSPSGTWLSLFALLPPAALLLCAVQLGHAERRRLALVLLLVVTAEAVLGPLQLAQGPASPLRLFALRNQAEAVGFFANRNHYAAQLYCLVPIAVAFATTSASDAAREGALRSRRAAPHVIAAMLGFVAVLLLLVGLAMARSRAGLGLVLVALLGSLVMTVAAPAGISNANSLPARGAGARMSRRLLTAVLAIAVLLVTHLAFHRIHERFIVNPAMDGRFPLATHVIEAARAYMPFGSGIGTFVPVFQAFEKPAYNFGSAYVNRAHNDYLELWLEAGLVGIAAMLLFLVWAVMASAAVWRRGLPGARWRDNLLACAATLVLALLLLHSVVDYPLRTTALMTLFGLAAAMVVAPSVPLAKSDSDETPADGEPGEATGATAAELEPLAGGAVRGRFVPALPRGDWPAAWRTPAAGTASNPALTDGARPPNGRDETKRS